MGQRLDDIPIVYGDNCNIGWAPGKTPKFVYARFSGLVKCPDNPPTFYSIPPNDRVFRLRQDVGIPCRWAVSSGPWDVTLWLTPLPLRTTLVIQNNVDLGLYFSAQPLGIKGEGFVITNEILACQPWHGAHLGVGVVTWTPQATEILEAVNIGKAYDLFMELFPLEDGKLVYKFCQRKYSTNVKILFEP